MPMVFAKKSASVNLDGEMYVAQVESIAIVDDMDGKNGTVVFRKQDI